MVHERVVKHLKEVPILEVTSTDDESELANDTWTMRRKRAPLKSDNLTTTDVMVHGGHIKWSTCQLGSQ